MNVTNTEDGRESLFSAATKGENTINTTREQRYRSGTKSVVRSAYL